MLLLQKQETVWNSYTTASFSQVYFLMDLMPLSYTLIPGSNIGKKQQTIYFHLPRCYKVNFKVLCQSMWAIITPKHQYLKITSFISFSHCTDLSWELILKCIYLCVSSITAIRISVDRMHPMTTPPQGNYYIPVCSETERKDRKADSRTSTTSPKINKESIL
jgi:hypothetical protein